ncbi:MAG: GIY-YIG nuclease family protein [Bauldia sp.]
MFFVYILASRKRGTLYVGQTSNLPHRIEQHRTSILPSFTRRYGVLRLVYAEQHETREDARQREAQLKRWARAWKIQLIEASNPDWENLFDRYGHL